MLQPAYKITHVENKLYCRLPDDFWLGGGVKNGRKKWKFRGKFYPIEQGYWNENEVSVLEQPGVKVDRQHHVKKGQFIPFI